jgi:Flp pilus assembly protein TadD
MKRHSTFLFALVAWASTAVSTTVPGQDAPEVGTKVVTKKKASLRIDGQVVDDDSVFRVYTVEKVEGNSVLLKAGSVSGWVESDGVVPFDRAVDYYTDQIREQPARAYLYYRRACVRGAKGEHTRAIADLDEPVRLDPKNAVVVNNRGTEFHATKSYGTALADFNESVRLNPNGAAALHLRAKLWANCPDARYRDGPGAVKSATKACELSQWKSAPLIANLAAAYAEVGDFPKAVELCERAVQQANGAAATKTYEDQLALFRDKKPLRE